jgi:hypothetical protein
LWWKEEEKDSRSRGRVDNRERKKKMEEEGVEDRDSNSFVEREGC